MCVYIYKTRTVDHLVARGRVVRRQLRRNVKRFRGRLVFKTHRRVYHSTLGSSVTKKKKKRGRVVRRQALRTAA